MKLYNTLTRTVEEFKPIEEGLVRFYQCGPTVYWVQHIGNLRAMTWADLIRRSFEYAGFKVHFVRNYTDVGHLTSDADEGEDKMEKGAKREGKTPAEIADKYIDIFENDIRALNTEPMGGKDKPRATEYIEGMIDMVQTLLQSGHAYRTEYAIYFDVSTFPAYNRLNRQNIDLNEKGRGKGTVEDPGKRHFADFALWFFKKGAHKNAVQTWPSPWGEGFPGWHIECSVMSKEILGTTIDVHMGGVEHIPVHHTNEIAQSETANGVPFVHYWIHNEHLNVNNEKMAKSQGTGFTLKEIREKGFDPLDLRYFFLQAHYRSKQNFTWEALGASKEGYKRLKEQIAQLKNAPPEEEPDESARLKEEYVRRFRDDVTTDFQIPQALALLWDMLKSRLDPKSKYEIALQFDRVFGLRLDEITPGEIPAEIVDLATRRQQAKTARDFKTADVLRNLIEQKGYTVEDTKEGYHIKRT